MSIENLFSFISGMIYLGGFCPLIISILRDKRKPAKITWLIWASTDTFVSMILWKTSTLNGITIGAALGAWIVFFLSVRNGRNGWTVWDKACIIVCIISIPFWVLDWIIDKEVFFGIISSIFIYFVGSIPTLIEVWKNPKEENRTAWAMFWISSAITLFVAINTRNSFEQLSIALTFFSIITLIMYFLFLPEEGKTSDIVLVTAPKNY